MTNHRKPRASIALLITLGMLAQTPAVMAGEPGRHKGLGLAVGLVAGILLGGYAAGELAINDSTASAGAFFGLWSAFAAGGAVAGYAAGGGFKDNVDQALDRGRESVQKALAARNSTVHEEQASQLGPADQALPNLRLSTIAGLADLETLTAAAETPVLQYAALR